MHYDLFGEVIPDGYPIVKGKDISKETGDILLGRNIDQWQPEKQYFAIGEVAAFFKVRTSLIRFWTAEFDIKVRTTKKGDRLYTSDQIKQIHTIHQLLKEEGYTILGARARLKEKDQPILTANLSDALMKLRNMLMDISNQLT